MSKLTETSADQSEESSPPSPVLAATNEGPSRRDEASISFRHFLQPQSDVVPTRHRTQRGNIDLVDGTAGLPDFVQDHLVVDPTAGEGQGQPHPNPNSPLDLAVIQERHPCCSSSSQRPTMNSNSLGRQRVRDNNEDQELTLSASTQSQSQSGTSLPDFLSDGPMHFAGAVVEAPSSTVSSSISGNAVQSRNESQRPSAVEDSLRQQIEELRTEINLKNRRILELEEEVAAQGQTISFIQASSTNRDRRTVKTDELGSENGHPSNLQAPMMNGDVGNLSNGNGENASVNSAHVLQIIESSENLARQLLHKLKLLKTASQEPEEESQEK